MNSIETIGQHLARTVFAPKTPVFNDKAPEPTTAARLGLTYCEGAAVALVHADLSDKEIAKILGCSYWTVRDHLEKAFFKLGVKSRTGAALAWQKETLKTGICHRCGASIVEP